MSSHDHKWKYEDPDRGWVLAICSHCGQRDAFPIGPANEVGCCTRCEQATLFRESPGELVCRVCGNRPAGPLISKRSFLRSRGVRKRLTIEEMAPAIRYARQHGITAAARRFGHPLSTMGSWAKGQSPFRFGIKDYLPSEVNRAFDLYLDLGHNFYATAKATGIPRSTLQNWKRKGVWHQVA